MERPGRVYYMERVPGAIVTIPESNTAAYKNQLVYVTWPNGRTDAAHRASLLSREQLVTQRMTEPPTADPFS